MRIYQGATYKIPIQIKIKNEVLDINDVEKVEFAFGKNLIKKYPSNDKTVERDENKLTVFLSSEDTLSLPTDKVLRIQSRITFNSGDIKFTESESIVVISTEFSKGGA